jgi:hypothetical protein
MTSICTRIVAIEQDAHSPHRPMIGFCSMLFGRMLQFWGISSKISRRNSVSSVAGLGDSMESWDQLQERFGFGGLGYRRSYSASCNVPDVALGAVP